MKLYAFGEILWDVFGNVKHIGGATLNIAAHFSLHGGDAGILSALGDDVLGRDAIKVVNELGIDSSLVKMLEGIPTGESIVTLNSDGVPSYKITENVAYDYIKTDSVSPSADDLLYFGTLSLRCEHNRKTLTDLIKRSRFAEIFADVNLRAPFIFKESIAVALENASILKISDEELPTLMTVAFGKEYDCKEAAKIIAKNHAQIKLIIITRGEKGAYVLDTKNGCEYEMAAKKANVVSTVGAGDSFSAAFLYTYTKGESIENCLENATRVSAFVVSVPEAVPFYNPKNL